MFDTLFKNICNIFEARTNHILLTVASDLFWEKGIYEVYSLHHWRSCRVCHHHIIITELDIKGSWDVFKNCCVKACLLNRMTLLMPLDSLWRFKLAMYVPTVHNHSGWEFSPVSTVQNDSWTRWSVKGEASFLSALNWKWGRDESVKVSIHSNIYRL